MNKENILCTTLWPFRYIGVSSLMRSDFLALAGFLWFLFLKFGSYDYMLYLCGGIKEISLAIHFISSAKVSFVYLRKKKTNGSQEIEFNTTKKKFRNYFNNFKKSCKFAAD